MHLDSPEFLLLLPAFALAAWYWPILGLWRPLRAAILVLVTLLLTDPQLRRQRDALDLHVLLDRSESTEDFVDQGLPEWRRLLERAKPGKDDRLRFVNFAAEVAELGADGSEFTGSRKLTRTALAMSSIAAEADATRPSRVLVFTDGHATEPLDEAAAQLAARGIPVDFRLLRAERDDDFRISHLGLPERAQTGEPFVVSVTVRGSGDGAVPLILRRGGQTLAETSVTLSDGSGTAEFTDRIPRGGGFEYQAEIRPARDSHPGNNRAARWIEVRGGPRLLLVTRYPDDPLGKALAAANVPVETVTDPSTLHRGRLSGARAVILHNVPAHEIPTDFLKSLDFFVREQGGGLMMAGGDRSFGAGGYFESPIDALLPVSMELKNEHRKLAVALAMVLDRSGSMAVGVAGGKTKMDLANAGAAQAIGLLGPMDQTAVFAVDSAPTKIVPLTTLGGDAAALAQRVRRITSAGGGIYVYEGLKAAWEELQKSQAGTRHVILFSDAQDSEEPGEYRSLLKTMTDNGCTVSVIGLGTRSDVDAALLEDIAARGKGRIFFSNEPMDIPRIFAQETVTIARSAFVRDPVGTLATGRWGEISPKPVDWMKQVDGYNLSYARPDATVSLLGTDTYRAPLVAHARRGLGRTVAVSFPLGGSHAQSVLAWPGYGDFLQTVARFLMGDETPPGIALRHRIEGTRLTLDLLYDPAAWSRTLDALPPEARLIEDASGTVSTVPWRRIAPGRFSLTRDLDEGTVLRGAVRVGEHSLPFGPLSTGNSAEWAFDPQRIADLRALSRQTGGRELLDLSTAWLRPPFEASAPLRVPLSTALLLLVLVEALVTRTGWQLPEWTRRQARPEAPKPARPPRRRPDTKPSPTIESPGPEAAADATTSQEAEARRSRFERAKQRQ